MNNEESGAMCKLYTSQSDFIAVCTTYKNFADSIPGFVDIGMVNYIDFNKIETNLGNIFYSAMHKRKSFEHEHEIRIVFWKHVIREDGLEVEMDGDYGAFINANLNLLIDKIYINPSLSVLFRMIMMNLLTKYDINVPVLQSEVKSPPAY